MKTLKDAERTAYEINALETFQDTKDALSDLYEAFRTLYNKFDELDDVLKQEDRELNDIIQERYPFAASFDDLWFMVKKWVESCSDKLDEFPI